MNWFKEHKLLATIGVAILLGVIVSVIVIGSKPNTTTSSQQPESTNANDSSTKNKQVDLEKVMVAAKGKFPTITDTKIFTEQNDPNNNLGKPGFYVAGAAFFDTRTDYTLDTEMPDSWGTDAGGSIEVYSNEAEAVERGNYLKGFQGGGLTDPGAYKQTGVYVLRASTNLTKSQQDEIIAFLEKQVQ